MKKLFSLVALTGMFMLMSINGFSVNHIENNFSNDAEASVEIVVKTNDTPKVSSKLLEVSVETSAIDAKGGKIDAKGGKVNVDCLEIALASFESFSIYFNVDTTIDQMTMIVDMFYTNCLQM